MMHPVGLHAQGGFETPSGDTALKWRLWRVKPAGVRPAATFPKSPFAPPRWSSANGSRRRSSAAPASTGMRLTIPRSRLRYLTRGQRASVRRGYVCPRRSLGAFLLLRSLHAPSIRHGARRQRRPTPGPAGRFPHSLSQTEGENRELFP